MMKLFTPVQASPLTVRLAPGEKVCVLGSCFADSMAEKLSAAGFEVCSNPFGTLYNPVSLVNALARLNSGIPFTEDDCVQMGAGAGLICSYSHHTSFARPTAGEFLAVANASLEKASAFWQDCNKVIITLGTAMVWRTISDGEVVANCLKRPANEFRHEMLGTEMVSAVLQIMMDMCPGKQIIFTVSPIRHMGEGAHLNTLSKATLHLALHAVLRKAPECYCYFPAYEILLDELRDYRYFARDLVHPSDLARDIIWERFLDAATDPADRVAIAEAEAESRRKAHRNLH